MESLQPRAPSLQPRAPSLQPYVSQVRLALMEKLLHFEVSITACNPTTLRTPGCNPAHP